MKTYIKVIALAIPFLGISISMFSSTCDLIGYYQSYGPEYPKVPNGWHKAIFIGSGCYDFERNVYVKDGRVTKYLRDSSAYFDYVEDLDSPPIKECKTKVWFSPARNPKYPRKKEVYEVYFIRFLESGEKLQFEPLQDSLGLEVMKSQYGGFHFNAGKINGESVNKNGRGEYLQKLRQTDEAHIGPGGISNYFQFYEANSKYLPILSKITLAHMKPRKPPIRTKKEIKKAKKERYHIISDWERSEKMYEQSLKSYMKFSLKWLSEIQFPEWVLVLNVRDIYAGEQLRKMSSFQQKEALRKLITLNPTLEDIEFQ